MRLAAEVVFIVVGAIGAGVCLAVLAVRLPTAEAVYDPGLRPRAPTHGWPAQLVRLAHIVEWSSASGLDAHTRLRPVLVEVAEARLARRGLRLDRDVADARRLLGQRDALHARFETLGVPVARWEHPHTSLELAIEEVTTFRRHARPAPQP